MWSIASTWSVPMLMGVCYSDFGGIFAELLPGNFAKLQPPEGKDLTEGLEVKVQLGSVWKQSLTELSGGQRCVHHFPSPSHIYSFFSGH